ncbi:MAG TPA: hypothetical protein VGL37_09415 [Solirubrobacteraceae bacterium]
MQISNYKPILLLLLALLGLGATTATSASASSSWFVAKTAVESGATVGIDPTGRTVEPYVLDVAEVTITCSDFTPGEAQITGPSEFEIGAPSFSGCSASPEGCEVPSTIGGHGSITPSWIDFPVRTKGGVILEMESAEEAHTMIALHLAGECPLSGEQHITGHLSVELPDGQTEAESHEFSLNSNEGLTLGESPVTLSGSGVMKLASGKPWSYR